MTPPGIIPWSWLTPDEIRAEVVHKRNSLPVGPSIEAPFYQLLVDGLNVQRKNRTGNVIRLLHLNNDFLTVTKAHSSLPYRIAVYVSDIPMQMYCLLVF